MKSSSLLIFIMLFFQTIPFSQDSLLIEKLKGNTYPFQFEEGVLSGEGFDFLNKIGQQTPFFLIGEAHGMAEPPKFTAALFKSFKKHGYQYFATETGPFTAKYLQKMASEKEWTLPLQSLFQKYPWSIPFYSLKEECTILEAVVDNEVSKTPLIWGLDQEFAASFRMNLNHLVQEAQTKESQQIATEYYNMAMDAYQVSLKNGDPSKSFMVIVGPSDFEKLKTAFSEEEKNLELIKELEESILIYQLWFQREGYQSNRMRAEMMKRHFIKYYQEAKELNDSPKIMFKFGSNHIYKGLNGLNVFDIGNFVSEFASQQGKESFHLYTLGRKGTQNAYTPFSKSDADKQKSYDPLKHRDVDFSTVLNSVPEDEWSIIDLRPVRKSLFNHSIKNINTGLEKIIWSYDAILVIPEVTASTSW